MSSCSFYIAYDGPALAGSEMDVNELAPALLALSNTFAEANRVLNGEKAEVHLNVRGSFKTGCFGIDLSVVQGIKQALSSVFGGFDVSNATDIVKLLGFAKDAVVDTAGLGTAAYSLISFVRYLKGRKIEKIELNDGLCTVYVDGDQIKTEKKILDLYQDYKLRKAFEGVVCKPLEKEGVDSFICADKQGSEISTEITKEEGALFACPQGKAEELPQEEYETTLQLLSPNFQEGNKWRFTDGSASFFAKIADQKFLDAVNGGRRVFAKGDIMQVKMRETKRVDLGGSMSSEKEILLVLSHRHPNIQIPLPGIDESRNSA